MTRSDSCETSDRIEYKHRKIQIISPGLIFVQKTLWASLFSELNFGRAHILLEGYSK